jgi:hypothetical protein
MIPLLLFIAATQCPPAAQIVESFGTQAEQPRDFNKVIVAKTEVTMRSWGHLELAEVGNELRPTFAIAVSCGNAPTLAQVIILRSKSTSPKKGFDVLEDMDVSNEQFTTKAVRSIQAIDLDEDGKSELLIQGTKDKKPTELRIAPRDTNKVQVVAPDTARNKKGEALVKALTAPEKGEIFFLWWRNSHELEYSAGCCGTEQRYIYDTKSKTSRKSLRLSATD